MSSPVGCLPRLERYRSLRQLGLAGLSQQLNQHRPQHPISSQSIKSSPKAAGLAQELGNDAVGVGMANDAERAVRLA